MQLLRLAIFLLLSILLGNSAFAEVSALRLEDYQHDVWTSKDGAPTDCYTMAQTADGWLWLSTSNGLYRFDGVRFERFQPHTGEALLDERLANVYAAPNGDLWFGYNGGGGVTRLRNGHLTHYTPPQPFIGALYRAHESRDGSVWFATARGLLRYATGKWERLGEKQGLPVGTSMFVFEDQYRRVWATVANQMFMRPRDSAQFTPVGPPGSQGGVAVAPDGRMWHETPGHIAVLDAPHTGPTLPADPAHGISSSLTRIIDHAGNFWIANNPGLGMISADQLTKLTEFQREKMPFDLLTAHMRKPVNVRVLLEDSERNIWAATTEGIERFRPKRVHVAWMDEKYNLFSIANDGPNALWIVSKPGGDLWHFSDEKLTQVSSEFNYVAVHSNPDRSALFSSQHGVDRRDAGQRQPTVIQDNKVNPAAAINAQSTTYDGVNYWVMDRAIGAVKLLRERSVPIDELGLPLGARAMKSDKQGNLWIIYPDKIIEMHGSAMRIYTKKDGLDIGNIHYVNLDREVVVLANNGVAVKIGDRFYQIHVERPDVLVNAQAIVASANGDRWINTSAGLLHVAASDWRNWIANPQMLLRTELIDASDGYPGAMTLQPSEMATTDNGNRVWFVGKQNLVWVDSLARKQKSLVPRVEVLKLRSGKQQFFTDEIIRLAPGTQNVSIVFSALKATFPERIRFKYRLEGIDETWQESGTRRTAYYTNVGAGTYKFQVTASNEDGVWGATPATMQFTIAPLFTETWSFKGLCLLAGVIALCVFYRLRMQNVQKQYAARLSERLDERDRIARSLHDTYLQSVQALVLAVEDATELDPHGKGTPALRRALAYAEVVLTEGRDQVRGLRSSTRLRAPLEQSFNNLASTLNKHSSMSFVLTSRGDRRKLRPHILEEIFFIGGEGLSNAFRHSMGTAVKLAITYSDDEFDMLLHDDGRGFEEKTVGQRDRSEHWGLVGMRERAKQIGARLTIKSTPYAGTVIALQVPARLAYAVSENSLRYRIVQRPSVSAKKTTNEEPEYRA